MAPRTDPDTITTLTLSLTSPADKGGANACTGLTEVERKLLHERIASGSTTAADRELISHGYWATVDKRGANRRALWLEHAGVNPIPNPNPCT